LAATIELPAWEFLLALVPHRWMIRLKTARLLLLSLALLLAGRVQALGGDPLPS
jgi:hypothetical protein